MSAERFAMNMVHILREATLENGDKIRVQDIPLILSGEWSGMYGMPREVISDSREPSVVLGEPVNLYPGKGGFSCFEIAIFVSLTSPLYTRGRGHFSFRQAVEKMVQHAQGTCRGSVDCHNKRIKERSFY